VARFHGGVRLPGSTTENLAHRQRQALHAESKRRIAAAIARDVPDGCALLINIGTTTEAVAQALLQRQSLRVITNNLNVAMTLSLAGTNEVIVAGGMESMTNAPYLLPKARGGYRLGHGQVMDHMFLDGLEDAY